nr:immunoglobulin light chain junction region [Macaca mulatta]MOW56774.1 immunoglobulin light chain junction region [Macaca mulatta]MOW57698.1 immunoglobulin light chain junction region [Macaca mulatta]MOW58784.1 immunoglobulin light chain junction region [Macaca mulatta]MOW59193.1 immunoglobulin light chain junction region [Macaca mulatta]
DYYCQSYDSSLSDVF